MLVGVGFGLGPVIAVAENILLKGTNMRKVEKKKNTKNELGNVVVGIGFAYGVGAEKGVVARGATKMFSMFL